MTITKNITAVLALTMLLMGFMVTSNYAAAATDSMDPCEELDQSETDDAVENEADDVNDPEDICEKGESVKLASQATVTEAQARKTALALNMGEVTEILLARDEDDTTRVSRIVYEIELTSKDGTETDVKVDANTGAYLGVDVDDDADGEAQAGNNKSDIPTLQAQLMSLLQQLIALLKAK